jgi:hypothetical protein
MTVLKDPLNGELTRDTGDGGLEVYCDLAEGWVQSCSCGPHVRCPEHLEHVIEAEERQGNA